MTFFVPGKVKRQTIYTMEEFKQYLEEKEKI